MKRLAAAFAASVALGVTWASAYADTTSITYPPADGGVATLPRTSTRKAIGIQNTYDVAICVRPVSSSVCWPVLPGAPLYLDAADNHAFTVRLCSGATAASCLPGGDAGVVTLEVQ